MVNTADGKKPIYTFFKEQLQLHGLQVALKIEHLLPGFVIRSFMTEDLFYSLVLKYTHHDEAKAFWKEIEEHYTKKGRHYHTLTHLTNLIADLSAVQEQISDWDTVLFSVFYHDFVYKATSNNNEEKSAAKAEATLKKIGCQPDKITKCKAMILATKKHVRTGDSDTDHFTDADLAKLGAAPETYYQYTRQI
jgi:predicted metal-dependent HD superfamily phosphohydrolase